VVVMVDMRVVPLRAVRAMGNKKPLPMQG
jgi:hypothetical protein